MPKREPPTITVGRLRQELSGYPDNTPLSFCGLTFYRAQRRAPDLVQIEFSEQVFLDDEGRVVVQNLE